MVAMYLLSGSQFTPWTYWWLSFSVWIRWPSTGVELIDLWPDKCVSYGPFCTSHTIAVLSTEPEMRWAESGDQQRSYTSSRWPLNILTTVQFSLPASSLRLPLTSPLLSRPHPSSFHIQITPSVPAKCREHTHDWTWMTSCRYQSYHLLMMPGIHLQTTIE